MINIQVIQEENEPVPFFLARCNKARDMFRKAAKENWRISRLVRESLKLGVVPVVNYAKPKTKPNPAAVTDT